MAIPHSLRSSFFQSRTESHHLACDGSTGPQGAKVCVDDESQRAGMRDAERAATNPEAERVNERRTQCRIDRPASYPRACATTCRNTPRRSIRARTTVPGTNMARMKDAPIASPGEQ